MKRIRLTWARRLANRIRKIAEQLEKGIPSNCLRVETENGYEDIKINGAEIIIDLSLPNDFEYELKKQDIKLKIAGRKDAKFALSRIFELLFNKLRARIKYPYRKDGRNRPENIGLTEADVLDIIKTLTPNDFFETVPANPREKGKEYPADVYKNIFRELIKTTTIFGRFMRSTRYTLNFT